MTFLFSSDRASINDELLSAYIDGEVTPTEKQRVEQALREHTDLRQKLAELQQTVALMSELEPMPLPRAFALSEAQVLAAGGRVRSMPRSGIWSRLFPRLMPLATATVAVALLIVLGLDFYAPGAQPMVEKSEIAQVAAEPQVAATLEADTVALAPAKVPPENEVATPRLEKREAPMPEALSAQAAPRSEGAGEGLAAQALEQTPETEVFRVTEAPSAEPTAPEAIPAPQPESISTSTPLRTVEWVLGGLLVIFAALTVWSQRLRRQ